MRLWSIHPRYLDRQGLVALWREGLLAQKVLAGKTNGYRFHPQLLRFRQSRDPLQSIGTYLHHVAEEASKRKYRFDRSKILKVSHRTCSIQVLRTAKIRSGAFTKKTKSARTGAVWTVGQNQDLSPPSYFSTLGGRDRAVGKDTKSHFSQLNIGPGQRTLTLFYAF